MSSDKEVKLYLYDVSEEWLDIGPWSEDSDFVEISYKGQYPGKKKTTITMPALGKSQFEELVKAVRYTMNWPDKGTSN